MAGTLFLVATPIGNLEDITYRARRVLAEAGIIACEDTRHTGKLLAHFAIATPTISYHEHNEHSRSRELIEKLLAGTDVALASDAGTPLISDPGYRLVLSAIQHSINVVSIPGPSAVLVALTASGFPTDAFHFAGFLNTKQTQLRKQLELLKLQTCTIILYEAPHRIIETLSSIAEVFGPDRPVVVARELTKLHEEYLRGTAATIQTQLAARPSVKGEITVLIGPAPDVPPDPADPDLLRREVEALIASGTPRMDAIKEVARRHRLPKRDVYRTVEDS